MKFTSKFNLKYSSRRALNRGLNLGLNLGLIFVMSTACSHSDSTPANPARPQFPSDKIKIVKSVPFTRNEKNQIKTALENIKFSKFISLLVPAAQESTEQKSKREVSLSQLNPEFRKLLEPVEKNCQLNPEVVDRSESSESTGQAHGTKFQLSVSQTKTDSADPCPVAYLQSQNESQELTQSNRADLDLKFEKSHDFSIYDSLKETTEAHLELKISNELKSKELRTTQQFASFMDELQSTTRRTTEGLKPSERSETTQHIERLLTLQLLDTSEMSLELAADSFRNSEYFDSAATLQISLEDKTTTLQVIKSYNKDLPEYYLNGELKNLEQIQEELGIDSDWFANISQNKR